MIYRQKKYDQILIIRELLKIIIPVSSFIFCIIIFFWPSISSIITLSSYNNETKNFLQKNKSKNFTFQGVDKFEQPFYLHAKKYQIIGNDVNKFFFEKPKAEINLKKGKWITMVAKKGVFDIENQTLELIDNVLFLHSDGQQIDTNNAIIDLKKAKIYGNKKIFGKTDTVNFSSDGFTVERDGKNFELLGKSKIKIKNLE